MKNVLLILLAPLVLLSCAVSEGVISSSNNGQFQINSVQLRGAAYSTPVKTYDNTVVLGTHRRSIYFLSNDTIKNSYRTKMWVHATPAIVYDSLVSIGSYDGNMYFFNERGDLVKKLRPGGRVFTNSEQLDSLWIVFATGVKGLWYYNFSLDSLYSKKTKRLTHGSPTVLANEQICLGSNDKKMYFFDKVGNLLSTFKTEGWIMHSKALPQTDSTVVFGSYDKGIYSVSSTGRLLWRFTTEGRIHASPQQFSNGNIICGSFDGYVYVIDKNGNKIAQVKTDNRVVSSAAIINGEYAVVGSYDSHLYFIDSDGHLIDKVFVGGKVFSSPILLDDGTIFCATTNGKALFLRRL